MTRVDLLAGFRSVKAGSAGASFGVEVQADAVTVNLDPKAIAETVAKALAEQVRQNLGAGLSPDGSPMPLTRDGRPRGVRTGLLMQSIEAVPDGDGFAVVVTGERGKPDASGESAADRVFDGQEWTQAGVGQPLVRAGMDQAAKGVVEAESQTGRARRYSSSGRTLLGGRR